MVEMTGAKAVCETLRTEGVKYVFGTPGVPEIPFLDALMEYPEIEYILALHEAIAVGMADGYARASGKPGVVNLHVTPGVGNAMCNIWNAYRDGVPMIILPGQMDTPLLIREPVLASNLMDVTRPFTKWSWQLSSVAETAEAIRRAFKVATEHPTGPVCLALPRNILQEKGDMEILPTEQYHVSTRYRGDPEAIEKAANLLAEAKEPLIIAGSEVTRFGAVSELVRLAELIAAPVYGEPISRSVVFPTTHPLYMGGGDYGQLKAASKSVDMVLAVGSKVFTDIFYTPSPIPRTAKTIHMHTCCWEIAKNNPVNVGIVSDPKIGLKDLAEAVGPLMGSDKLEAARKRFATFSKLKKEIIASREEVAKKRWDAVPISGERLAKDLYSAAPDAIIVDAGVTSSTYLNNYFEFEDPNSYYSGGAGWGMGWGYPAALGVQLAVPSRKVIAFLGDGDFAMTLQGLWTASRYNIPVVAVICDNGIYRAVKRSWEAYGKLAAKRGLYPGVDLGSPDMNFARIAENFNVYGARVERPEEVKPAMREALSTRRPAVVDIVIDPEPP